MLYGTIGSLHYHSNITQAKKPVATGIHGISDHLLDTPWPKVVSAENAFRQTVGVDVPHVGALFDLLRDRRTAEMFDLRDTGLPLERERQFVSIFIQGADYGTRCSTVIMVRNDGHVLFEERTFHPVEAVARRFEFMTAT